METLTLQIWCRGYWQDACLLTFPSPDRGASGSIELEYYSDYGISHFENSDARACSVRHPVLFSGTYTKNHWFNFIDDIIPAGAARRYWLKNLGIEREPQGIQEYALFSKGTIAPIGNLRIKEAIPYLDSGEKIPVQYFEIMDVLSKNSDFLSHANEMGAVGGGATGAGGEAPKYLVRCTTDDKIWIDAYQDDPGILDQHYLVKFPRNQASELDKNILRAEAAYYKVLDELGVNTIDTNSMRLYETNEMPSLWLPRFDVAVVDGKTVHRGMESIYSLLEQPPGTQLRHLNVMESVIRLFSAPDRVDEYGHFDAQAFVTEWIKRDFLNVVFGNSDNHGRNTAFLKWDRHIELSPIYDFSPMKADPEGIIRLTRWGDLESGGKFDWYNIAAATEAHLQNIVPIDAAAIVEELRQLVPGITNLKEQLASAGAPEQILNFPALGFDYLDRKLEAWGLF